MKKASRGSQHRTHARIRFGLIIFIALINLVPIYWMIISSLKRSGLLISTDPSSFLPTNLSLNVYRQILSNPAFQQFAMNSLIVASAETIITLLVSGLGAYSLARLRFAGSRLLGRFTLMAYVVPPVLLVVPMYIVIVRLGLQRSLLGLILAHISFAAPFCIWMLRGFFMSLPPDLEEAALLDGATYLGALVRILLPLALPGLVAAMMFAFLLSWNEYLYAFVFISSNHLRTLPLGISSTWKGPSMTGQDWSALMAACTLTSIPMFIMFAGLQRWLVAGLTAGSVKG